MATDNRNILDKIKKCLALSASANEHEAAAALRWKQWPVEQALTAAVRAGSILRRRGRGAQDVTYTLPGACK